MDIQNLVREKVIGHIKTGTKGPNGLPQKLPYFNVEEDKVTSSEMVNIFKQLYPEKPTKLRIRFTSESPLNLRFKRYIKGKAVCIGNNEKAITIGKDNKGNNTQIEIKCNEDCEQRACGKCKLVGSLKFVLDGIEAGGLWKINTSGGFSLSNLATEITKYKNAGMSIVDVPFELTLSAQESLAYGTYYSIDLKRTDIKPMLTSNGVHLLDIPEKTEREVKQLTEGEKQSKKTNKTEEKKETTNEIKKVNNEVITETKEKQPEVIVGKEKKPEEVKEDFSNYLMVKEILTTVINNTKFDKIIFQDMNLQDVEYVLHPKAEKEIIKYGQGTLVELVSSKIEMGHNILCKYNIKQIIENEGKETLEKNEKLKEAV